MIQAIIDGIIAALLEAFPGIKVYDEQVKQGLTEPCFILYLVNPTNELIIGKRYHRTHLFTVQYIPKSKTDGKAECAAVTDALFQVLEYIMVDGDLRRGTGMNAEYTDGVLSFMVNYDMIVRKVENLDMMGELDTNNMGTKG